MSEFTMVTVAMNTFVCLNLFNMLLCAGHTIAKCSV